MFIIAKDITLILCFNIFSVSYYVLGCLTFPFYTFLLLLTRYNNQSFMQIYIIANNYKIVCKNCIRLWLHAIYMYV